MSEFAGRRSSIEFALDLPSAAQVEAHLYDVRGREVATLFEGSLGAGRHTLSPRTKDALPSGAYFARAVVRSGGETTTRTARSIVVR